MNAMDFDDLLFRTRQPAGAVRGGPRALHEHLPPRAGRRVPGHQPRPVPAAAAARRGRAPPAGARRAAGRPADLCRPGRAPQPRGGRRRRAVDLQLPAGRHPQHPRLPGGLPRRARGQARAELPLDRDDPVGGQRGDRQQPRRDRQAAVERARARASRSSCARWTTSTPRRASSSARSSAWSTRALRARRSRCCTARTRCRG